MLDSRPRPVLPGDSGTPLSIAPPGTQSRPWVVTQRISHGVEYEWQDGGQRWRLRAHAADADAPSGSYARGDAIYRVQKGSRYFDATGRLLPRPAFDRHHPRFEPNAQADTHIPWPKHLPVPWQT